MATKPTAASAFIKSSKVFTKRSAAPVQPPADADELAGWRSVWDAPEVEHSPALEFLSPRGTDARTTSSVLRLSLAGGERA